MQDDGEEEPITLHFWPTPNGLRFRSCSKSLPCPNRVKFVDIGKREQFAPEFLWRSRRTIKFLRSSILKGQTVKPLALFESGAILQYLGRKFGAF